MALRWLRAKRQKATDDQLKHVDDIGFSPMCLSEQSLRLLVLADSTTSKRVLFDSLTIVPSTDQNVITDESGSSVTADGLFVRLPRRDDWVPLGKTVFGTLPKSHSQPFKMHEFGQPSRIMLSRCWMAPSTSRAAKGQAATAFTPGRPDGGWACASNTSESGDSQCSTVRSMPDGCHIANLGGPASPRAIPVDVPDRVYRTCPSRLMSAVDLADITKSTSSSGLCLSPSGSSQHRATTSHHQHQSSSCASFARSMSPNLKASTLMGAGAANRPTSLSGTLRIKLNRATRVPVHRRMSSGSGSDFECALYSTPTGEYGQPQQRQLALAIIFSLEGHGGGAATGRAVSPPVQDRKIAGSKLIFGSWPDFKWLCPPDEVNDARARCLRQFVQTHAALIDMEMRRLQASVSVCFLHGRDRFYAELHAAWQRFVTEITRLHNGRRLCRPAWLCLTSLSPTCGRNLTSAGSAATGDVLVDTLAQLVDEFDCKDKRFFLSKVLTAVLMHHLAWVNSVAPVDGRCEEAASPQWRTSGVETSAGVLSTRRKMSSQSDDPVAKGQKMDRMRRGSCVSLVDSSDVSKEYPYNPFMAQYLDITGAGFGYPVRRARVLLVGQSRTLLDKFLFVLSYFIRCGDVKSVQLSDLHRPACSVQDSPDCAAETHKLDAVKDTLDLVLNETPVVPWPVCNGATDNIAGDKSLAGGSPAHISESALTLVQTRADCIDCPRTPTTSTFDHTVETRLDTESLTWTNQLDNVSKVRASSHVAEHNRHQTSSRRRRTLGSGQMPRAVAQAAERHRRRSDQNVRTCGARAAQLMRSGGSDSHLLLGQPRLPSTSTCERQAPPPLIIKEAIRLRLGNHSDEDADLSSGNEDSARDDANGGCARRRAKSTKGATNSANPGTSEHCSVLSPGMTVLGRFSDSAHESGSDKSAEEGGPERGTRCRRSLDRQQHVARWPTSANKSGNSLQLNHARLSHGSAQRRQSGPDLVLPRPLTSVDSGIEETSAAAGRLRKTRVLPRPNSLAENVRVLSPVAADLMDTFAQCEMRVLSPASQWSEPYCSRKSSAISTSSSHNSAPASDGHSGGHSVGCPRDLGRSLLWAANDFFVRHAVLSGLVKSGSGSGGRFDAGGLRHRVLTELLAGSECDEETQLMGRLREETSPPPSHRSHGSSASSGDAVCIVADVDQCTVEVLSAATGPNGGGGGVQQLSVPSDIVAACVETVAEMRKGGMDATLCLWHVESCLVELYTTAMALAQTVESMADAQNHAAETSSSAAGIHTGHLAASLGVSLADLPLLMAVAARCNPESIQALGPITQSR